MPNNTADLIIKAKTDQAAAEVRRFASGVTRDLGGMSTASAARVKALQAQIKGIGTGIAAVGKRIVNLKTLAVGAFAGWGIKRLSESLLDVGSGMDQMQISLDTITKGRGVEWFERLNEWALKMPVNTEKAIKSFTMMRAMGLRPSIADMTTLVDATSALGGQADTMEGISRALGQITTKGKVSTEELMQLAERGVPVFDILREKLGLTSEQLGNIGNEAIDADKAVQALIQGMAERFGGQSQKIQDRYKGLMEGLVSYWKEFQRLVMGSGVMEFVEAKLKSVRDRIDELKQSGKLKEYAESVGAAIKNAAEKASKSLSALYDWWQKHGDAVKENIKRVVSIAAQLGKLYIATKLISGAIGAITFFTNLAAVIGTATVAVKALTAAQKANLIITGSYAVYKGLDWLGDKVAPNARPGSHWNIDRLNAELKAKIALNKELDLKLAQKYPAEFGKPASSVPTAKSIMPIADLDAAEANARALTKIREAEQKAAKAVIETALKTAQEDAKILKTRLSEYQSFYDKLQGMIDRQAAAEKKHIQELTALYKDKGASQLKTQELIAGLRETTMTPVPRYESQKSALTQEYIRAAQLSGKEQIEALEKYKQKVADLAREYKSGITETSAWFGERVAVSGKKIIDQAVSDIERAAAVQQRAYRELESEKRRQIEIDRTWKDSLKQTAAETASGIKSVEESLAAVNAAIAAMQKEIDIKAVDYASPVIDQIRLELESLRDKSVTVTTVHRDVYVAASEGAADKTVSLGAFTGKNISSQAPVNVKGSYATGTRYVPETGLYELHRGEQVVPKSEVKVREKLTEKIRDIVSNTAQFVTSDHRTVLREVRPDVKGAYETGTDYVPKTGRYEFHRGEAATPDRRTDIRPVTVNFTGGIHVTAGNSESAADMARKIDVELAKLIKSGMSRVGLAVSA